jgi:hypothetical protein
MNTGPEAVRRLSRRDHFTPTPCSVRMAFPVDQHRYNLGHAGSNFELRRQMRLL